MSPDVEIVDIGDSAPSPAGASQHLAVPSSSTGISPHVAQSGALAEFVSVASSIEHIVDSIHSTQMVTSTIRGRRAECLAVALRGHELGIPIMQALGGDLYIVDGKVGMSAELMRALVARDGHRIDVVESSAERAVLTGTRSDTGAVATVEFTIADAQRAGLTGPTRNGKPSTWDKYPRAMLTARATSELCRLAFPDVLRGVSYTPEELDSIAPARNVVSAAVIEPDFEALGWTNREQHDERRNAVRGALADAPEEVREQLLELWNSSGLRWPLSVDDLDAWVDTCRDHGVIVDAEPAGDIGGQISTTDVVPEQPPGAKDRGRGADASPGPPAEPPKRSTGGRSRVDVTTLDQILEAGARLELSAEETRQVAETIVDRSISDLGLMTRTTAERVLTELLARVAEYGDPQ